MNEERVLARFAGDVAEHEMTVLRDDGLYRHVRFKKPGTISLYFDLITWPGCLTIHGDMGTWTFSRIEDMFSFFAGSGRIDLRYWHEKIQGERDGAKEWSPEMFRQHVTERYNDDAKSDPEAPYLKDLWVAITEDLLTQADDEHAARSALYEFQGPGDYEFTDSWEWGLMDYTYHFIWCCYAIRWGVEKYRASIPAVAEMAAAL